MLENEKNLNTINYSIQKMKFVGIKLTKCMTLLHLKLENIAKIKSKGTNVPCSWVRNPLLVLCQLLLN